MKIRKTSPKSEFKDAVLLNNSTYFDYLERLKKIALAMFEWQNLPSSMNARYIELCLYYKGQAALLYDNTYGFINTSCASAGYINLYGIPTKLNCYSYSFNANRNTYSGIASEGEKDEDAVLVMNTYERIPTCSTIELFALRLAEAQRTADVNIKAQRTPVLILTDAKQLFTMKKVYEEYDGNTPVLFADKNSLTLDSVKSMKTDAPFIAQDIMDYKREIWNEALTFLGISNLSEKRERMISSEVDSNNELINLNLQSYLAPRKKACEEFNQKFGTNIDVKVRSDLYNIIKQAESIATEYQDLVKANDTLEEADGQV